MRCVAICLCVRVFCAFVCSALWNNVELKFWMLHFLRNYELNYTDINDNRREAGM